MNLNTHPSRPPRQAVLDVANLDKKGLPLAAAHRAWRQAQGRRDRLAASRAPVSEINAAWRVVGRPTGRRRLVLVEVLEGGAS